MGSLRQSSSEDLEKLLDGMLAEVERELPAWSSIALPFPLPSYRSKLGTVKRMLAALLDGEDLPRRRRSAIFQLAKQVRTVFSPQPLNTRQIRFSPAKFGFACHREFLQPSTFTDALFRSCLPQRACGAWRGRSSGGLARH